VTWTVAPKDSGSSVEHVVEISPRGFLAKLFMGKLMSPLIRRSVKKQLARDMAALRSVLAAGR
jgi:hypothetical protein